jgi:hypothetical protein
LRLGVRCAPYLIALLSAAPALGCDICAVYTGFELQATEKGVRLGLSEQLTRMTTLQDNSLEVSNPGGERLESLVTQMLLGYQLNRRFGVQIVVPVISRSFRRVTGVGTVSGNITTESGDVSGFGDMSLLANVLLYNYTSEDALVLVTLYGGLELPSGNSNLLAEEVPAEDPPASLRDRIDDLQNLRGFRAKHAGHDDAVPSGIHGHDLALGSGSVDAIFALRTFGTWRRCYADANVQYYRRGRGSFSYEYADLLIAYGGPAYFVVSEDDTTLGLQALFTLETKGKDSLGLQPVDDTGFTGLYVGPALHLTWSTSLSAELAADLPAIQNNTGLQIVPSWRLRFGAVWRF